MQERDSLKPPLCRDCAPQGWCSYEEERENLLIELKLRGISGERATGIVNYLGKRCIEIYECKRVSFLENPTTRIK